MAKTLYIIPIHSYVDLITNSSYTGYAYEWRRRPNIASETWPAPQPTLEST